MLSSESRSGSWAPVFVRLANRVKRPFDLFFGELHGATRLFDEPLGVRLSKDTLDELAVGLHQVSFAGYISCCRRWCDRRGKLVRTGLTACIDRDPYH